MNEELLQKLYSKYNLAKTGSFDEFRNDMQFPEVQKRFFDKYNLAQTGSFDEFKSDLGYTPTKQTIEAPVEPPAEAPGFFTGLFKKAKTTFGPQKEKSQILTELQQAPVDYTEYTNKQKVTLDPTKVSGPVAIQYNLFQENPIPTEQDFNTLSLDQIKKKYGSSQISNRKKGLMDDENRFSIPISSMLDQLAGVPKEQQASVFKGLVNDALRKVREQQVSRKDQLESQIAQETAGIPQTFGEAVSRGELGTYVGSAIGGAAGSSAVALTRPLVGGYELTKGEILDMANKAKAESLGQTENEFIISGGKLDSNAAVEVGSMVSSALEYVGLGKIAAPLFKNLMKEGMKSAIKKGIVEVGKGAATEFSTEFVQSVNEQVSSQMAAGKKPEEIVINWDDALESGIQGGIGGGGLTTVSTVTSGLTNAVAKRRKIEQIDNEINRLTDTGSPEINQQIDSEAIYDQERQIGVPSGEQQGATTVQEGTQPQGGRAQAETGGVLQVSPETPGAQEEVGDVTVGEVLDKSGVYQGKKGLFYKDPEGQAILFKPENENRVYEVGNIDEISNKPISDFGIEYTESVVGTTEVGNFTVRGNEYVNKYSNPLMAINQDKAGNIVSVNLETTDGKKRTFRGNIAEDLAYQIKLKQITQNNEQLRRFEEFINTPEVATQISGLPEVTAQETTGITQQVPTTQPAGQVTPEPTVEQTVQQKEDELINVAKQLENIKNPTALDEIVKKIGGNKFVNKFRKKAEGDDEIQKVQSIDEIVNRKPTSRIKIKGNEIIFKDGSSLFDKLISENFSQSEASNIIDTVQRIFPPEYIESYPDSFKFENVEDISSIIEEEYFKRYINEFRNEERIRDNFNKARVFINQLEGATYSNGDLIYTKKSIDFIKNVLDEAEKGNAFVFTKNQLDELGIVKKQDIVNFGSFDLAEAYQKAKQDGSNPELVKAVEDLLSGKPVTPTTQPAGQVTTEDLEAEGLRELEQLEQPTPPQPTVEQPTVEQPTTEQPVTPQPEAPTTEQPANLNDFKRYFFNKDPKAFGGNLGTALGMSQVGWQKAYNKFAKTATPEEIRMLDALRGKEVAVQPQVEEQVTEEEVILIDKTALLNAGYTNEQIKLVEDNPEKFGQIDDKIVNLETNEVIKPTGKKKVQVRPKRRPKQTFPKKTYADLEKAMFTPGVKLDELLRIVIGMNNYYSALAEQLLNIYKSNKTVRLAKFDTKREGRDENNAWGVYRPNNTVAVFVNDIKKYWNDTAKSGKISPSDVQPETESNVTRVLLHEIVHGFTVRQINNAIPATQWSGAQLKALQAYLKHGDNQGIKDIITLYLSAREQIKDLEKKDTKDAVESQILKEARGTKAYGLKNIEEFLTEAFTRTEFQRLLNRLESPITPKKSIGQSFVDAVKKILRIATTGAKELSPVKAGSLLESVLRVAPDIMITDQQVRTGYFTEEVNMSPAPQDPRTAALIKVAQGLINKGATRENVIDRVKQSIAGKFNIDVDAYAQDILAGINVREKEVTGEFNSDTEVANIVNTPYNQILTSKKPDNVSAADFKQQQVEALADFLRGKVNSKEQIQDFVITWNDANPNNLISKNITNEAWDRLKTGRPQPAATTTVKINDIIRTQAQIRAKGKAEGVRETTKQFREKLIKMVQDAVKASNLTRNQINSMLAAVKRVNLFTPGSINKLADRIAKLEADAAYADKVNQAKALRKELSRLARPKEAKVSNYTALARAFLGIDVDYITSYTGEGFTGLDPLDAYIAAATAIKNGFANPKLDRYERIIVSQVQDYINNQIDFKNEEQARELAENAKEDEIKLIATDGMSVDELQKLVDELLLQERAQELQEELRTLDNPEGILNQLNSVDLNTLNASELATYIHVVDNIIANEDYSLVDRFSNKLLAREKIAELNKTLGSVSKGKLIKGYKGLQQITQMLDAIFNISNYAALMYNLSGIYDYIAGTARVENRKIAMAKALEKEIDRIDSKSMGKPQLRLKTEQAKLLMLSELAKYTLDSTEHIEKVHDNIQMSIDKWKGEEKEFGNDLQKIYDKYKNVKSAEEAIEAFQKNDPHVYELWKYITTNVFTKQLADEIALNTKSVHNKVFIPFVNYSPTALKTIDIEAAPAEQQRKSAKPVQAGTTKEARRMMNTGQAYNFDDYISDVLYAFTETVHDVETSKHLQLFNNVANNSEFKDLIGGSNNRNYIIERVVSTDKIERKMGDQVNETVNILNKVAEGISQFGVTTALGGLDQMALQYPSAAVTTMIMLGSDAGLFFAAPTKLNPKMEQAVNKILEKQDIAVRGQAHKYELNSKNFDFKSKSKIIKGLSKIRSGLSYIQKDLLLKPLILSDMSVAQRSYIAFYLKSLREQGYKNVDLMTEPDKMNDPSRKQALAYASMMLSNLQVASTSAGRSAFIQEPGNLGVLRKIMLPFSSFPINTKIRMMRALNKMYSTPKKSEGYKELLAVMTEAATFASIKIYLLPFYYAAVKAGMEAIAGFESPEDEEDEDRNKNERKLRTQLALEAIPFNVGSVGAFGSQWLINNLNYGMSDTEARTTSEFLKDMGDDPMFERMQNWSKYNEFYGYGQYGIGMDRYADIINAGMNYFRDDFITLDNGYGEQIINKDSQELERLAMLNLLIQASPLTLREMRSQMGKIEREQFKMARERQKE